MKRKNLSGGKNDCGNCFYYKYFGLGLKACHYLLITGTPRPCPAEKCTVKLILSDEETKKQNRKYYEKCMKDMPAFESDKVGSSIF